MVFGVIIVPINAIVWIILVLLAVIGLSAVIQGISHAIFCSGMPQCCCTVAVLQGDEADVALRKAIEQASYEHMYDKGGKCRRIIAVDMGLEPNMLAMCKLICSDYDIALCDRNTLISQLEFMSYDN